MNQRANRLFTLLVAAWAAALLIALVLRVADRWSDVSWWLNYPFPREGSEGLTMYEALLTRLGDTIYALPTTTRFISAPYPPLYYYLSGLLLDPNAPTFPPGRWLSLFAGCAAAIIAGLLAFIGTTQNPERTQSASTPTPTVVPSQSAPTTTQNSEQGQSDPTTTRNSKLKTQNFFIPFVLSLLLFATTYPALIWAARFRADMLALALMVGGLLALQLRPRGWVAWLGALLFAVAFLTKQTALAGPLAAAIYLLILAWQSRRGQQGRPPPGPSSQTKPAAGVWGGNAALPAGASDSAPTNVERGVTFRWAFVWIAGLAGLFLLPTLLFSLMTGGGYWAKLVTYHALPFSSRTLLDLLGALLDNEWPLLLLAIAFLLLAANDLRRGRAITIVAPYLFAATLLLPTGGVVGADSNHLLPICFGLVVAAGQLSARIIAALLSFNRETLPHPASLFGGVGGRVGLAALTLLALLAAYLFASNTPSGWYGLDLRRPSAADQTQLGRIVANVQHNPGVNFLSDEVGLLVLAGKRPAYDDLFDLTALANLGRWDDSALRQQVQNRQFAIILLHSRLDELRGDILTEPMRTAISGNYRLLFADIWYTYVPK